MANKFIIEIRTQGFKGAKKDLENVNKQTRGFVRNSNKASTATAGFRRTMSSLRNNLLLVTFAFGGIIAGIKKFVDISSGFEAVKVRLVGLTGSVQAAEKAFDTFNEIAATTPFALDDIVEAGASLTAFGVDAENMIKPVADLAAFMGTTAREAAMSLGRAFAGGAGAADILRERGILQLIKDFKGINDLTKVTLPDFREMLIETLQDPMAGIAGSTDRLSKTFIGSMSNMKDSLTRMSASIGESLIDFLSLDDVIESIGDHAKRISDNVKMINDPISALSERMKALGISSENLQQAIIEQETREVAKAIEEEDDAIANLSVTLHSLLSAQADVSDIFNITTKLSRGREHFQRTNIMLIQNAENFEKLANAVEVAIQQHTLLASEADPEDLLPLIVGLEKVQQLQVLLAGNDQIEIIEEPEFLADFVDAVTPAMLAAGESISVVSAEIKTLGIELQSIEAVELSEGIRDIGRSMDFLSSEQRAVITGVESISSSMATAILNAQDMEEAFRSALRAMAAELLAQATTFALLNIFTGGTYGTTTSFLRFAFGHTGGLVTPTGIQKFAGGGSVLGGVDTVPAMLQPGEFVLSKNAVQNMGVESAKAINQGKNAGGITVNISAPLVDETVIDSIIPAIEKAQRLNLA